MLEKYLSTSEISEKLEKIQKGDLFTWPAYALLMLSVEYQRYWELDNKSFSGWLKYFSKISGKSISSCWRFMSSAKFYDELSRNLTIDGKQCPRIGVLNESVSPENLEILSKLEAVLPKSDFVKLAWRVIENDVTRKEVREIWKTFRPMLEGKTKRGLKERVTTTINLERQNATTHDYYLIQDFLLSQGKWLNLPEPHSCMQFKDFVISGKIGAHQFDFIIEVMIMTVSKYKKEMNFHLVDYLEMINKDLVDKITSLCRKVNNYWVIGLKGNLMERIGELPDEVGVIFYVNGTIEVYKQATHKVVDQSIFMKKIILESIM